MARPRSGDPSDLQDNPQAFILMENLMMEVSTDMIIKYYNFIASLLFAGIQRGDRDILRVIVQTVRQEELGVRVPLHPRLGAARGRRLLGLSGDGHDLLLLLQVLSWLQ